MFSKAHGAPIDPASTVPQHITARHAWHHRPQRPHNSPVYAARIARVAPHVARIRPKNQPVETSKDCSNPVYGDRMRILPPRRPRHRAVTTVGILFLIVATLSGCSATPAPVPAPSDTAAPPVAEETAAPPVFASDDEALAAAEAAYSAYTQGSNEFAASPKNRNGSDKFGELVSQRYLPEVTASLNSFAESGNVGRGAVSFDTVSLLSFSELSPGHVEVSLYLCADVSGLRVLDAKGVDVTAIDRSERTPTQVAFVSSVENASKLLVDREDTWTGRNFCG